MVLVAEKKIQNSIMLTLGSKPWCRIFRNNVGTATTSTGSFIRFGLAPGSSDLIGITKVKITPDMVGKEVGIFTAIEVKDTRGKVSDKQKKFIDTIKKMGGIAFVARSAKEALDLVKGSLQI